jgi:hypothetical protein
MKEVLLAGLGMALVFGLTGYAAFQAINAVEAQAGKPDSPGVDCYDYRVAGKKREYCSVLFPPVDSDRNPEVSIIVSKGGTNLVSCTFIPPEL